MLSLEEYLDVLKNCTKSMEKIEYSILLYVNKGLLLLLLESRMWDIKLYLKYSLEIIYSQLSINWLMKQQSQGLELEEDLHPISQSEPLGEQLVMEDCIIHNLLKHTLLTHQD